VLDERAREDLIERISSIFTNEADARSFNEDPDGFVADRLPEGTEGEDVVGVLPDVAGRTGLDFSNVASTGGSASAAGQLSHTYETIYQQNSLVYAEQGAQVTNVQGDGNAVAQQQGGVELDVDYGEGELDPTGDGGAPPLDQGPGLLLDLPPDVQETPDAPTLPDGTPTLVQTGSAGPLGGHPIDAGPDSASGGLAPAGPLGPVDVRDPAAGAVEPPVGPEPATGDDVEPGGGQLPPGPEPVTGDDVEPGGGQLPPELDAPWEEPLDYGGVAGPAPEPTTPWVEPLDYGGVAARTDATFDEAFAQGADGFVLPDGTPTLVRAGLGEPDTAPIDALDTSPVVRPGVDDGTAPYQPDPEINDSFDPNGDAPGADLLDPQLEGGSTPDPVDPDGPGETYSGQAGEPDPSTNDSFPEQDDGSGPMDIDAEYDPPVVYVEPEEPIDYGGVAGPPDAPMEDPIDYGGMAEPEPPDPMEGIG
jgi:hypothetical protein